MNGTGIINSVPALGILPEPEDYMQDGLLWCGKCKTARQVVIEVMGNRMVKACMCKCRSEAYDKGWAEFRAKQEVEEFRRMRAVAVSDPTYRGWTFEQDDGREPRMEKIRRYVENWDTAFERDIGLLLWGDVGTGKSFAAACIVNELTKRGVLSMMTSFRRIERELFGCTRKNALISDINRCKLLVIDDLGVERDSEYMNEVIFEIVDARYRANRPLIVTTNYDLDRLKNPKNVTESRIFDRVLEMTSPVKFTVRRRAEAHDRKLRDAAAVLA